MTGLGITGYLSRTSGKPVSRGGNLMKGNLFLFCFSMVVCTLKRQASLEGIDFILRVGLM